MIKRIGRWLFLIPAVRITGLYLLYLSPGLRKQMRIYLDVEGKPLVRGLPTFIENLWQGHGPVPELLPPRPAQIYADLSAPETPKEVAARKASRADKAGTRRVR